MPGMFTWGEVFGIASHAVKGGRRVVKNSPGSSDGQAKPHRPRSTRRTRATSTRKPASPKPGPFGPRPTTATDAQAFTARNNPRVQMAAPCPRCQLKTLAHSNGESFISCRNPECELLLSREEYERRVKEMADAITLGQAA
jgi:ssDNA-binding Zn-finger/Zn-ribbon topoisomerase 1